ncbi:MAG TPA: hypothetical protein VFY42_05050, partial [Gemmatimonadales bacterium]|nr:hypothetical protein [Gemmatimonadales bacterium]
VIGSALSAREAGAGHRTIAVLLGRPVETVRGWLRRFAARLEPVRAVFTGWCRALAVDPDRVLPGPAGSRWADTLAAIGAAACVARARLGAATDGAVGEVARWETAVAVSAGRLLAPDWPDRRAWSRSTRVHPPAGRSWQ